MTEEKLELKLVSSCSQDILKLISADTHEKVGEMTVNIYTAENIEGRAIIKEVYDKNGEFKAGYFSDFEDIYHDPLERLKIQALLKIPIKQAIISDNKKNKTN